MYISNGFERMFEHHVMIAFECDSLLSEKVVACFCGNYSALTCLTWGSTPDLSVAPRRQLCEVVCLTLALSVMVRSRMTTLRTPSLPQEQ